MNHPLKSIIVGLMFSTVASVGSWTSAQLPEPFRNRGLRINVGAVEFRQVGGNQAPPRNDRASLKTDPELEAILEKAERFREEKQYGIASKLWQSVLERSGDALYTADNQNYFALAEQVEQIIAQLPPNEGLNSYRIVADASAKAIMAEAGDPFDERALKHVVRHFFLSSLGDDAALTLSAIYMDQYDFIGAYRMLKKVADRYPDPSISLVDVYTRMALCLAMIGESKSATEALEKARTQAGDSLDPRLNAVAASLHQLVAQTFDRERRQGYALPLGDRSRGGVMPALPRRVMQSDLEAVWQYYFAPKTLRWADIRRVQPLQGEDVLKRAKDSVSARERSMIEQWRQKEWRPSGALLFANQNVFFKTSVDITVWDQSLETPEVVWRPLWRNHYELDDYTQALSEYRRRIERGRSRAGVRSTAPAERHEIQLFSDTIASQMSIQDGILYSIEGNRFDVKAPEEPERTGFQYNLYSRRARSNHLTAFDVKSGKLLWTLPQQPESEDALLTGELDSDQPWIQSGGFMSAPIHYDGLALVAVNHSGAISICALDPQQNGKTVWQSYLCDESETGANPFSPINLSIDGSDLFATTGMGVVFILDPSTGLVRLAKRYSRHGIVQTNAARWGRTVQQTQYASWLSDTVLAYGRQMICFSSDARFIEAFDRNTGDLIWRSEAQPLESPVDYLLGVFDGVLYAGGKQTILAYDLTQEGRMIWGGNRLFGDDISYGRGMLTSDGIFLPVENRIIKYDLKGRAGKPRVLGQAQVSLGTGAPVGNLFSDGTKIWVHGANRVYALGPARASSKTEKTTE